MTSKLFLFLAIFPWTLLSCFGAWLWRRRLAPIAAQEREMDSGFAIYRDPVPVPKHSRVSGGCSHQRRKLVSKQALGVRTTP